MQYPSHVTCFTSSTTDLYVHYMGCIDLVFRFGIEIVVFQLHEIFRIVLVCYSLLFSLNGHISIASFLYFTFCSVSFVALYHASDWKAISCQF